MSAFLHLCDFKFSPLERPVVKTSGWKGTCQRIQVQNVGRGAIKSHGDS